MKKQFFEKLKHIKTVWDAFNIFKKLALLFGVLTAGVGTYFAEDVVEYAQEPEVDLYVAPEREKVNELVITHIKPGYAPIDHTHDYQSLIKQAIKDFEDKHDPAGLGH